MGVHTGGQEGVLAPYWNLKTHLQAPAREAIKEINYKVFSKPLLILKNCQNLLTKMLQILLPLLGKISADTLGVGHKFRGFPGGGG